ncbi:MAG: Hsp70 family protein [Candidatus Omnitrophica bacterium]|nr:Hsp70 family protein [Candidatus Omnitrophota bacterium]
MTSHAIGIDFGTLYSRVSVMDAAGTFRVLADPRDSQNRILFPSLVALRQNGYTMTGWEAADFRAQHPERVIASVKKWLGRETVPTEVDGKKFAPEEICSFVFKSLKLIAEEFLHGTVFRVVITFPGIFEESEKKKIEKSARLAGFSEVRLLEDALALGAVFQEQERKFQGKVLFYHYGGGFFHVSLVEFQAGRQKVLARRGDSSLGAEAMDLKLAQLLWQEMTERYGSKIEQDKVLYQFILDEAERAKRAVSHRGSYDLRIPQKERGFQYQRAISRFEVVDQIRGMIESTLPFCEEVLKEAGVKNSEIDRVILAGGATRIPFVKETVQKLFAAEKIQAMNLDETVALGTVRHAHQR